MALLFMNFALSKAIISVKLKPHRFHGLVLFCLTDNKTLNINLKCSSVHRLKSFTDGVLGKAAKSTEGKGIVLSDLWRRILEEGNRPLGCLRQLPAP